MSTFQLHDGINDNKRGEPSIDGFILSIPRRGHPEGQGLVH